MDATAGPCEEGPDILSLMVGRVIPDDMDDAFVRVACLDFSEELNRAFPIDRHRFDERRIEGFQVQGPWILTRPRPVVVSTAGIVPALTQPNAGLV